MVLLERGRKDPDAVFRGGVALRGGRVLAAGAVIPALRLSGLSSLGKDFFAAAAGFFLRA